MAISINDVINQLQAGRAVAGPDAASGPTGHDAQKLKALAGQFESMLVAQMLQEMRASMFDNGDDASSAPLADSLFAELSLALSRAGGFGFSESIAEPLLRQGDVKPDAQVLQATAIDATRLPEAAPGIVLPGRISSAYGWRQDPLDASMKFHKGMDIALPHGQDVPAPREGRVVFAGEQPGYGKTVIVEHGGQMRTRYAHLSEIAVKAGDDVTLGQLLGKVGATGRATGPHLHLEVLESGQTVNPAEKLATYTGSRPQ
jgi:murein DD-endopeptidase MepM/ murein hydrolase activator NlpD